MWAFGNNTNPPKSNYCLNLYNPTLESVFTIHMLEIVHILTVTIVYSNEKLTLILDYNNLKKNYNLWECLYMSMELIFINSMWSLNNSSLISADMIFNLNSSINFNNNNHGSKQDCLVVKFKYVIFHAVYTINILFSLLNINSIVEL